MIGFKNFSLNDAETPAETEGHRIFFVASWVGEELVRRGICKEEGMAQMADGTKVRLLSKIEVPS